MIALSISIGNFSVSGIEESIVADGIGGVGNGLFNPFVPMELLTELKAN